MPKVVNDLSSHNIVTCMYCLEPIPGVYPGNYADICDVCPDCRTAFDALRDSHRVLLRTAQEELEVKLRRDAPQTCPHCKGTGKKS